LLSLFFRSLPPLFPLSSPSPLTPLSNFFYSSFSLLAHSAFALLSDPFGRGKGISMQLPGHRCCSGDHGLSVRV
jgi:hypothetical protein